MLDFEGSGGGAATVQHSRAANMTSSLQMPSEDMVKILATLSQKRELAPRYVALSQPYSPCTQALHDLEAVKLPRLTLASHNRGLAVILRRTTPLVHGHTRTLCGIVDGDGNAAFLELTCTDCQYEEAILREDIEVAIKEPFVTPGVDVSWCIRVDHPSDLCKVHAISSPGTAATVLKERGNGLYKDRRLGDAAAAYEEALCMLPDTCTTSRDLHRNLAQVYLSLDFWELAVQHAKYALDPTTTHASSAGNVKARFRAALASYHLRDFSAAKESLEGVFKIAPTDKDGRAEMLRTYKRLNEQQGAYDFDEMLETLTAQSPHVDAASFAKRTMVSLSAGKGNGLFATEDFETADLVLCEKAFAADFSTDPAKEPTRTYDTSREIYHAIPASLWRATVQKIVKNPSLGAQLMRLGGNWEGLGDQDLHIDGTQVIDVFQVHDVVARNSFEIPTPSSSANTEQWGLYTAQSGADRSTNQKPRNSAIFTHAAFINHSCCPNVEKRFIGDMILIRATRPIAKGEEILLDYAPGEFHDVRSRRQGFERTWQFTCTCELCNAESEQTDGVLDRRISPIKEANERSEELSRNIPISVRWDSSIAQLEGLTSELRSTYGPAELPKALAYTYTTLALLHGARKDFASHLRIIVRAFESLGWCSPFEIGGSLVPRPSSATVLDLNVPQLLYMACSAATATGDVQTAEVIKDVEPKVYLALNGVINGFKGMCARLSGKS